MYGLDLFSGIGGITKALEGYVKPVAYCENDRYAQGVLLSRISDGSLPAAPIWDDVKTLRGSMLPIKPDIIYGGFPCQDISVAGRGAGLAGERSGLFFEIVRLVGEVRPRFVFLENVAEITNRGGVRVVAEITSLGYDCRWIITNARLYGHDRKRWFCLAYSKNDRCKYSVDGSHKSVNQQRQNKKIPTARIPTFDKERFHEKIRASEFIRTANGIRNRMDRIHALGNAVVPAQAREAFERLIGIK